MTKKEETAKDEATNEPNKKGSSSTGSTSSPQAGSGSAEDKKTAKPKTKDAEKTVKAKTKEEPKKTPGFPEIKSGMTVRVHQKIKEKNPKGEEKERIQVFEGMVLARKHGKGINSTITVRKISGGIGVEKIFPLHLPTIAKIEVVKKAKLKRSKAYYLRSYKKKLKEKKVA